MSKNIFGLDFKPGLGYSHNSGPPIGGWPTPPGTDFYGQPLNSVLPYHKHFGSRKKLKKRKFGYPLTNTGSEMLNLKAFPLYPVGNGLTPGGDGGVFLQGLPGFDSYWGYGKIRKNKKSSKRRKSKKR